jgi:hypothetical protein
MNCRRFIALSRRQSEQYHGRRMAGGLNRAPGTSNVRSGSDTRGIDEFATDILGKLQRYKPGNDQGRFPPSGAQGVKVTLFVPWLRRNYAARVLLFPERVSFTFFTGFGVADTKSMCAVLEPSSDVCQNFPPSIQPMNVRLALRLTIGDPEVVGTFANFLFQAWHDSPPFDDARSLATARLTNNDCGCVHIVENRTMTITGDVES